MAEIRNYLFCRHYRAEQSAHVLLYRGGRLRRSGRGLAFWFLPMSTSISEVPVDDRELSFLFHARSSDFQDVTVQGAIGYRIAEPRVLSERIDFSVDLHTGAYRKEPLEQLAALLGERAQELTYDYLGGRTMNAILTSGQEPIRTRIENGLRTEDALGAMGLEVVGVRITAVKPAADLEKALEMPTREHIQQQADEATFQRRALAVEKERAIEENELQNRIELARREEQLIEQQGQNERRRCTEAAEAARIASQASADRMRITDEAQAEGITRLDEARNAGESARMAIYRDMPSAAMAGLAARELAGKLDHIDHLNISPELLGPMLQRLMQAGTSSLEK